MGCVLRCVVKTLDDEKGEEHCELNSGIELCGESLYSIAVLYGYM